TAAFRGLTSSDQGTTIWLNQAQRRINGASVPVNWSEIFARNNGSNATDIHIEFFDMTGNLVTSQTASGVAANGMAQFLLKDSGFSALGNNFNGWVKVSSGGEPLAVDAMQVVSKGKRLFESNGLTDAQLAGRYVCGDLERNTTQNSHVTILNT